MELRTGSKTWSSKRRLGNTIGDRLVPTRAGNNWLVEFHLKEEIPNQVETQVNSKVSINRTVLRSLLDNEVLDREIVDPNCSTRRVLSYHGLQKPVHKFNYSYSVSQLSLASQKLLQLPRKATRNIPLEPSRILDAPNLIDATYLNLVDWSVKNVVGVGLSSCVYLWIGDTGKVFKLCDLDFEGDTVTSVSWDENGNLMSVGTKYGKVQV